MKAVIAGSRSITNQRDFNLFMKELLKRHPEIKITRVISGGAPGVDSLGEQWARNNRIPITQYLAKWGKYGKSAGFIRNELMAKKADCVLVLWDGKSKGTAQMIRMARKYNVPDYVCTIVGDD